MTGKATVLASIVAVVVLALMGGPIQAQGPDLGEGLRSRDLGVALEGDVSSRISYQGILKEAGR